MITIRMNHALEDSVKDRGVFANKKSVQNESDQIVAHTNGVSIFAGDSNLIFTNQIGQEKADAQKKALKELLTVLERECDIDKTIKAGDIHKEELESMVKTYDTELEKLEQNQMELKENYGIQEDSEEEKNLNLLKKIYEDPSSITEEDMTRLENMGALTQYQRSSLEYEVMKRVWKDLKKKAIQEHADVGKTVEAIQLERLKSDPMVKAKEEAQDILEQASSMITAQIYEEAKENISELFGIKDTVSEKNSEDVNEAEIENKRQKQLKMKNDNNVANQEILERLKTFMKKQRMLTEDTLGIKIDTML